MGNETFHWDGLIGFHTFNIEWIFITESRQGGSRVFLIDLIS